MEKKKELDSIAEKLLAIRAHFDARLHEGKQFPLKEFGALWDAVNQYTAVLSDGNLIHRDVAREISGLREYLELKEFKTPGEVLAKADRMECILFSGQDPYGDETSVL